MNTIATIPRNLPLVFSHDKTYVAVIVVIQLYYLQNKQNIFY